MRRSLLCSLAFTIGVGLCGTEAAAAPQTSKIDANLELTRRLKGAKTKVPSIARLARPRAGAAVRRFPIVIELTRAPTAKDLADLEALGARIAWGGSGKALGRGRRIAAEIDEDKVDALAADARVTRIALDARPFEAPRPLDLTSRLVGADVVHARQTLGRGRPVTGEGVTVCDIDSGLDPLHPMFFKADGGYFSWNDEDGNGTLDPGVDTVDVDGERVILRAINGIVSNFSDQAPLFGTEDAALDLRYDYLYADINDDGVRNVGRRFGFDESSPGLGEMLFVVDDVDDSGTVQPIEKLVALGSSKVKAFRIGDAVYRRGENLLDAPWEQNFQHGTGASGVLVGGQVGYRALTGVAPDADLVVATDPEGGREFVMTSFCIDEGARVVLHEYAPWVTFHLDGSSSQEQLIDETFRDGIIHVNPAGNLSGARKATALKTRPGKTRNISLDVPDIGSSFAIVTLLWRDPSRDLGFKLRSPSGNSVPIPEGSTFEASLDGFTVSGTRDTSSRGTVKVDLYLYPTEMVAPIEVGEWAIEVADPAAPDADPVELHGYVFDEVSGWKLGVSFGEDAVEEHLIGWPATADLGMAISAFTGHGFDGETTGARAAYSGRGHRIDGEPIMFMSAPDNPIVPGHFDKRPLAYLVYGGTSGASPHVAGAAALLLASEPDLTAYDIRDRLRETAVSDSFTGHTPNDDFGWGKLDVHRALFGTSAAAQGEPPVIDTSSWTMEPGTSRITLAIGDPDDHAGDLTVELDRDYDGTYETVLAAPAIDVDYENVGEYVMKLRVTDPSGLSTSTLIVVDVAMAEQDGDGDGSDVGSDDDDGCSVGGSTSEGRGGVGAFIGLAAVAAVSALRRRARRQRDEK